MCVCLCVCVIFDQVLEGSASDQKVLVLSQSDIAASRHDGGMVCCSPYISINHPNQCCDRN